MERGLCAQGRRPQFSDQRRIQFEQFATCDRAPTRMQFMVDVVGKFLLRPAFYEQEVVKGFDELTHESSARSFWRVRAEAP